MRRNVAWGGYGSSFFSLVLMLGIFNTGVGGLGASRWLLEGRILQREKEGGEGEGFRAGC